MELFKILGTVAIDGMDSAAKGLEGLGNVATKVGKAMAAGLAAGATAVGALAKKSLDAYAEYEQLIGGVETLYGAKYKTIQEYIDATGISAEEAAWAFEKYQNRELDVLNNASNAYKTAGMSANEYMNTVNGFAASLTSSLGEYEWQAANYADMIVTDMADNANKMGTSIEAIQNAYSGFAKQNFTMLDNLKLGYGGTKEEMQRLLHDAEELAGYEFGSLDMNKFADVADAINIIQEEMGITGTTAREAAATISGSLASTKAAWQNLMTGFADDGQDLGVLIDNLVGSATTAVHNIVPRLAQILTGISDAMTQIMPVISAELPAILQELLPGVINGAVALLNGLIASLPMILQILIEQLPSIFMQISAGLMQTFPILLETVKNLFGQIWDYIAVELLGTEADFESSFLKIQQFFQSLWEVLLVVWETIGQPVWETIMAVVDMVYSSFQSIMPQITAFVQQCFLDIQKFWTVNLKPCLEAIGNFIRNVLAPIFRAAFFETIWPAVEMAFNFIKDMWENTLKPVFTGITDFLTGVFTLNFRQAFEGLVSIVKGVANGIINGIETMINGAINALNGLIAGLNKTISLAGKLLGLSIKIPTIGLLKLPRLEEGGILEKGQVGLLEGNGAEAVVPLDQNKAWISAVAKDMGSALGGSNEQTQRIIDLLEMLVEMLPDTMKDAFASMKFDINNREFARMVKAVG